MRALLFGEYVCSSGDTWASKSNQLSYNYCQWPKRSRLYRKRRFAIALSLYDLQAFAIYRAMPPQIRSHPGKPNQIKGQNEKFMNFAHFVWILEFFLMKTSTIHISNFCSGMPPRKVHELTFLWFGLPGPLLIKTPYRTLSPFRPSFFWLRRRIPEKPPSGRYRATGGASQRQSQLIAVEWDTTPSNDAEGNDLLLSTFETERSSFCPNAQRVKNLLTPLFLYGLTTSVKRPPKVGKRPLNDGETAH